MAKAIKKHTHFGGARLPLALLACVLALVGGTVTWLTLITDIDRGSSQEAKAPTKLPPGEREPVADAKPPTTDARRTGAALTPPPAATRPSARRPAQETTAKPPRAANRATPKSMATRSKADDESIREAAAQSIVAPLIKRPIPPRETRPKLPRISVGPPLSTAPDPALIQNSVHGPLPIIGADGRKPWRVYARPFAQADKRPRVAIVITGLGLSGAATDTAIQSLPGAVTLAFAPYAPRLREWIRLARAAGHEVLLNVPMEPVNYPNYDPGPQTLLTTLSPRQNHDRLLWTLGRGAGYVGVVDFMGSRFTMSREHINPVLIALERRGLLFLDSRTAPRSLVPMIAPGVGLPWVANQRLIDERASREAIDERLREVEMIARKTGRVVAMGSPYPVTLERVALWARELNRRGIVLAPVTAVVSPDVAG